MDERPMPSDQEFEKLVNLYYGDLYRFGFSLAQNEADAADLVQQTFYVWATKGYQLRLASNAKRWLLTTLHREFLQQHRRCRRFSEQITENPPEERYEVNDISQTDVQTMLDCLKKIHENYRAPLVLYYLEDLAYKEIAEVLAVPVGTVQSRIARGKSQLGHLVNGAAKKKERHIG